VCGIIPVHSALKFFCIHSSHQSADVLVQYYPEILTFLKDCDQHLSHPESICLLTRCVQGKCNHICVIFAYMPCSILHVLVCRASRPVDKRIRRDLQVHVFCFMLNHHVSVLCRRQCICCVFH